MPTIVKEKFHGAPHTVSVVVRAALESQNHFVVRQVAEQVCRDLRSKDTLSDLLALLHFVTASCRYMKDPRTIELVKAPYIVCEQLTRDERPALDCDDYTSLLAALGLSVGAQMRVVTVAFSNQYYNGERQYSHVFAQGFEPKAKMWVTLDPVAGEKTSQMLRRSVAAKIYPVA